MPYFLDSNVIIGYYFACADRWGYSATNFFNVPDPKHTSSSVWGECFGNGAGGKCRTISDKIKHEFLKAIRIIKKESLESLYFTIIDEGWRITPIVQDIIMKYGEDSEAAVTHLRDSQRIYEAICNFRYQVLNNGTVTVHKRSATYIEINNVLIGIVPDMDDVVVLLDAHHVAQTIPELIFVSGDRKHILTFKDQILNETNIQKIISLDNF